MFTSILGLPLFPWTPTQGYALGDVNYENFRYLNHFLETDRAQVGRATTTGSSARSRASPGSTASPPTARATPTTRWTARSRTCPTRRRPSCSGALGVAVFPLTGIPVLDGSRSECNWDTDPDAVVPGIFGPSTIPTPLPPRLRRERQRQPLALQPRAAADRLRPRDRRRGDGALAAHAARADDDRSSGSPAPTGCAARVHAAQPRQGRARQPPVRGRALARRARRLLQREPGRSARAPARSTSAPPARCWPAWDGHDDLDSKGAILFRRFVSRLLGNFQSLPTGVSSGQAPGSEADLRRPVRSAADPVNTPRGLNTDSPLVGTALADAVTDLAGAGIPLDGTLRQFQYETRGGKRIPIHGGPGHARRLQRDQRHLEPEARVPGRPPRLELHRRDDLGRARLPGARAELRHLRRVREPDLAARSRLHEGVLAARGGTRSRSAARDIRAQAVERRARRGALSTPRPAATRLSNARRSSQKAPVRRRGGRRVIASRA